MNFVRPIITVLAGILLGLFLIGCSMSASIGDKPTVIFCDNVNDEFEPINQKTSFPCGDFTALLSCPKAIDLLKLQISLARKIGEKEKIVNRIEVEVNPKWNKYAAPVTIEIPNLGRHL